MSGNWAVMVDGEFIVVVVVLQWLMFRVVVVVVGGVRTLNLSRCPRLTDVSMFGSVHTLGLEDCA